MIKERDGDKALRVCDECSHEQWVNYWNIYRKSIHLCRYCNNRQTSRTRVKFEPWNLGKKSDPKEPGSSYVNNNGYIEVWIGRKLTEGSSGYYKEHRLLIELDQGRRLGDSELVHHVDGDKTNNSKNNLFPVIGHHVHRHLHSDLERVSFELVKSGAIKFDSNKGSYYIDPNVRNYISKSGELLENPTGDAKDNQQRSFKKMTLKERSETIQKWSTLKRVEAPDTVTEEDGDDIVPSA